MSGPLREMLRGLLRSPEGKELIREFVAVFREELVANGQGDEWQDQKSSQCRSSLGRNRWCKAVRERLERDPGDPHAKHIGDRYLLDTVGLSEELERASRRPAPTVAKVAPCPYPDESPRVTRVLRLLGGSQ